MVCLQKHPGFSFWEYDLKCFRRAGGQIQVAGVLNWWKISSKHWEWDYKQQVKYLEECKIHRRMKIQIQDFASLRWVLFRLSGCINVRRKISECREERAIILPLNKSCSWCLHSVKFWLFSLIYFIEWSKKKLQTKMVCNLVKRVTMLKIKPINNPDLSANGQQIQRLNNSLLSKQRWWDPLPWLLQETCFSAAHAVII